MARFYLPPALWLDSPWCLPKEESHHASKVMRLQAGDTCTVFDGLGHSAHTKIVSATPDAVQLACAEELPPALAGVELTLYQAIPKGNNMELIIQKAVELGVTRIVPLLTQRTIVRLNAAEATAKQEKWQRIALESCKQCGQNVLPQIELPLPFEQWLRNLADGKQQLPACAIVGALSPHALPLRSVLEPAREQGALSAGVLIGPEGDLTPAELEKAIESGFTPVTLGNIILRSETAAFFTLSALRYALQT